ncbi:anaphase-promoting complex subunit 5-domain-containing protein [Halteromyces radiatus]|uniref:anaphase-promoting complex subunit 5-domain-containing protein n=1 Tax=Halteromyces radiatus TaxID=101107 RepID=UPI00221E6AF7|nr:anaphase-promoting complex subunit 5-domain-containing protein [Halteromyces radiatus]KAI8085067.1 anaphase-promoting complex subunit 5-domain-containing protein [Halteromyces radiatus]
MKRALTERDNSLLSETIRRTRFITPFKIVLTSMIYEFCHFQMFPTAIVPKAVTYMVQTLLEYKDAYQEPSLQDVYRAILTFDDPPNNIGAGVLKSFQKKLLDIKHPDELTHFMNRLESVLVEKVDETGEDVTVLDAGSVFGMFVRRCRIEYFQASIDQVTEIFEIYRGYVTQTADDRQLDRMLMNEKYGRDVSDSNKKRKWMDTSTPTGSLEDIGSSSISTRSSHKAKDPLHLNDSYKLGGWLSDTQMDNFLNHQAELIEKTGTSDIPPASLHRYLDYLQKHAPDLAKIHQVRFLNYIRTADYEGAVSCLHMYFDYCFLPRETPMYHYALLNLGVLEAKFGHTRQSLYALEEAVKVAREHQDEECLNEIQSWIYFVKGSLDDQHLLVDTLEIADNDTPNNMDNSIYFKSIYKLSQVQDMVQHGDLPYKVFETLFQCNIQPSIHGIGYLSLPYNMIKYMTWKHYGNSVLADTFIKMALKEHEGTAEDKRKLCILTANMSFSVGDHEKAIDILLKFAEEYPDQTAMSLEWKQAYNRIHDYMNQNNALEDSVEGQINQLNLLQPGKRQTYLEALHEQAETCVAQEDYETALHILEETHRAFKETDHASLSAKNLILRAQIYIDNEQVETAINLLQESLTICKKAHDAFNYYCTTIKLANGYLLLSNDTEKALYLLECCIPNVMILGSPPLIDEMNSVYNKALKSHRDDTIFY